MEQQTPIEYWKEMNTRYENWINNFNACPVLRLSISEYDLIKNESSVEEIVKKIGNVLNHSQKYMKSR